MELISVIVPVYNVEDYLIRCVRSIQNQSYKHLEIILVDDGSPDRCPQMCDELAEKDPRIKVLHKKNGGLGFARNSGLDVAIGEYVTFIDSDDWISETHIENLYCALVQNSADAVIGSHTRVRSDGIRFASFVNSQEGIYIGEEVVNKIVLSLFGTAVDCPVDSVIEYSACMNLYRMNVISDNSLRFVSERCYLSEDLYFNIDYFIRSKKVVIANENGYYYYQNNASISRKYDSRRFDRTIRYYYKLNEKCREYNLADVMSYRIDRSFLMKIRILLRLIVFSDYSYPRKIKEIKKVLNDKLVQQVLNNYPISRYPLFLRLFSFIMRLRSSNGTYFMVKIREILR